MLQILCYAEVWTRAGYHRRRLTGQIGHCYNTCRPLRSQIQQLHVAIKSFGTVSMPSSRRRVAGSVSLWCNPQGLHRHDIPETLQVVQFYHRELSKVTNILTSLEHQMAITKEAYHAEASNTWQTATLVYPLV